MIKVSAADKPDRDVDEDWRPVEDGAQAEQHAAISSSEDEQGSGEQLLDEELPGGRVMRRKLDAASAPGRAAEMQRERERKRKSRSGLTRVPAGRITAFCN